MPLQDSETHQPIPCLSLSDDDDSDFEARARPQSPDSPPIPAILLSQALRTSQNASLVNPKPRSAISEERDRKKEDQQRRKAERERKKVEKDAEKEAARQKRVLNAFRNHSSTPLGRQSSVRILVSTTLYNDHSKNDVLKQLRVRYAQQIEVVPERRMSTLITWRRQNFPGSSISEAEDVPMCIIYFSAQDYLKHISEGTLYNCAQSIKDNCLQLHRIMFVVTGMNRDLQTRNRRFVRNGMTSDDKMGVIITKDAVQDTYVHLYMTHGIRTHEAVDLDEFTHYLCNVTEAIAGSPFRKEKDCISASITNRVFRAKVTNRTVVIDSQVSEQGIKEGVADEDIDPFSYDPVKKTSQIRVESSKDLGNMYLSMLCLVPGVTNTKAKAIRERYPTLRLLLDAYDECSTASDKAKLLADLRSGDRQRRLGPVLSKNIATVLTSIDPKQAV